MENKIKVGDKVRAAKDAPRMYVPYWRNEKFCATLIVKEVNDGNASVLFEGENPYKTVQRIIPTKYLIKVDTEEKYRVGDKVVVHYSIGDRIGRIQEVMMDGTYDIVFVDGCTEHNITRSSQIEPYSEPTEQTEAEKTNTNMNAFNLAKEIEGCDSFVSIRENIRNLHRENNQGLHFNPFRCNNFANAVGESDYWKHYTADLAKEVVLKVANKYNDPKEAAEYAVLVAKAVVEGLKRR